VNSESNASLPAVRSLKGFSIRFSDAPDDPDWDDFLERCSSWSICPQTSCWGQARASAGWEPTRAIISTDGGVVAGVNMVTHPLPVGGNIGFVCRGPVVPPDNPDLVKLVFDEMLELGRSVAVNYLVVQPPRGGDWMSERLAKLGFRPGAFDIDVTATVRLDLSKSLDELFSGMSPDCQGRIRQAERNGVTVRLGTEADIPVFNRLHERHCLRLGRIRRGESYFQELWRALAPRGHIELFIAEYEGEPVSAVLAMPFGEDCYNMERSWMGELDQLGADSLVEWETIKWAKAEGYRYGDLDGIDRQAAETLLAGQLPSDRDSESFYKAGFGGQVLLDPPALHYVYNPLLRSMFRLIPEGVMRSESMRRLIFKFRVSGS